MALNRREFVAGCVAGVVGTGLPKSNQPAKSIYAIAYMADGTKRSVLISAAMKSPFTGEETILGTVAHGKKVMCSRLYPRFRWRVTFCEV